MKLIFGLAAVAGFASSTVSAYATFKHHDVRSLLFRLPPLRILQPTHSLSLFLLTVQQRRPRPGSFLPFLPFPMVCASYETGLISSLSFSFFFSGSSSSRACLPLASEEKTITSTLMIGFILT
jgi:hypothetical protein